MADTKISKTVETAAKTETASKARPRNPILKENFCCVLFFLLLPFAALTVRMSLTGAIIFAAMALLLILRFAVFDKPDEQLAIGHFGWYFTISMITVFGIHLVYKLPDVWIWQGNAGIRYPEELGNPAFAVLAVSAALLVVKKFLFGGNIQTGKRVIRAILDHLALAGIFTAALIPVVNPWIPHSIREKIVLMVVLALYFSFCDCYEQCRVYTASGALHHKSTMRAAAVLYAVVLIGMFITPQTDSFILLFDFTQNIITSVTDSILIYLIPLIFCAVTYFVCFKGPFASQEIRIFTTSFFLLWTMFRYIGVHQTAYGWLILLVMAGIAMFALFYRGKPDNLVEKKFIGHREYQVLYAGASLWLCLIALQRGYYLTVAVIAAAAIVLLFLFCTAVNHAEKAELIGKAYWMVVSGAAALAAWSMLLTVHVPANLQMGSLLIGGVTEAALILYARGKQDKFDKGMLSLICVVSCLLQWMYTAHIL